MKKLFTGAAFAVLSLFACKKEETNNGQLIDEIVGNGEIEFFRENWEDTSAALATWSFYEGDTLLTGTNYLIDSASHTGQSPTACIGAWGLRVPLGGNLKAVRQLSGLDTSATYKIQYKMRVGSLGSWQIGGAGPIVIDFADSTRFIESAGDKELDWVTVLKEFKPSTSTATLSFTAYDVDLFVDDIYCFK